jgi:integrase/recombinase XerC
MDGGTGALAEHLLHLKLARKSPATRSSRALVLGLLAKHASRPVEQLGRDELDAWQNCLLELAPASQATYISHVRAFYRWMVESGRIPKEEDPSTVLVRPRVPRGIPMPLEEADLARVLSDSRVPHVVQIWIMLAAYDGLRASEIAGLRREDVLDGWDPPMLAVTGKGGKTRLVPLAPSVLAVLLAWGMPEHGRLFRREDGRPVTGKYISSTANRWLHRLGLRAGPAPATIHKGRHRFATQALDRSGNLRMVQELLGHDSPASTAIYTRVLPRAAAPVVAAVDHPITEV